MTNHEAMVLRWSVEGMDRLDWADRMIGETYSKFPDGPGIRRSLNRLQKAQDCVREVKSFLTEKAQKMMEEP